MVLKSPILVAWYPLNQGVCTSNSQNVGGEEGGGQVVLSKLLKIS